MPKVVVITGATSGIGEATAKYFVSKGYKVYSLARHIKDLEGINYLSCDVTNPKSVNDAFQKIYEQEKQIDDVINNAGMGISGAFEFTKESDSNQIIDVNLKGVMNVNQAAIPFLKETKGRIVHIGSIAGELAIPFQTHYSVTKAAVHMLSESLGLELKPFGIKVCCVMPGDTKTGFTAARVKDLKMDGYGDRIKHSIERMEADEQNGCQPIKVSKVIYKCVTKKHPPIKVAVGFNYKLFMILKRILPNKWVNRILYQLYGK